MNLISKKMYIKMYIIKKIDLVGNLSYKYESRIVHKPLFVCLFYFAMCTSWHKHDNMATKSRPYFELDKKPTKSDFIFPPKMQA